MKHNSHVPLPEKLEISNHKGPKAKKGQMGCSLEFSLAWHVSGRIMLGDENRGSFSSCRHAPFLMLEHLIHPLLPLSSELFLEVSG